MPALLFGGEHRYHFDEEELRAIAMEGGVVSPYTSYLAEMGGAPAVPQLETFGCIGGIGMSGISSGCGCCGGIGMGGVSLNQPLEWLRAAAREAADACGVEVASVSVEVTGDEIVDLDAEDECVRERLWTVRLPDWFSVYNQRRFDISL